MQHVNGQQPGGIPLVIHPEPQVGEGAYQLLRQVTGATGQIFVDYVIAAPGRTVSVRILPDDALAWASQLKKYGEMSKAGLLVE